MERVAGIEPAYSAWKAAALPLSYTRGVMIRVTEWWRELDLNQRRLSQRIYSPSPLTTRASLHFSVGIKRPSIRTEAVCLPEQGAPSICAGYMTAPFHPVNTMLWKKLGKMRPPRCTAFHHWICGICGGRYKAA